MKSGFLKTTISIMIAVLLAAGMLMFGACKAPDQGKETTEPTQAPANTAPAKEDPVITPEPIEEQTPAPEESGEPDATEAPEEGDPSEEPEEGGIQITDSFDIIIGDDEEVGGF